MQDLHREPENNNNKNTPKLEIFYTCNLFSEKNLDKIPENQQMLEELNPV